MYEPILILREWIGGWCTKTKNTAKTLQESIITYLNKARVTNEIIKFGNLEIYKIYDKNIPSGTKLFQSGNFPLTKISGKYECDKGNR